jgi:hypothetical protein
MAPNMTKVTDGHESAESDASLHLLSNSELGLMQSITLNQMKERTGAGDAVSAGPGVVSPGAGKTPPRR